MEAANDVTDNESFYLNKDVIKLNILGTITNNEVNYDFKEPIKIKPGYEYNVKAHSFSILYNKPNVYTDVNDDFTYSKSFIDKTIKIPQGLYNYNQLNSYINLKMEENGDDGIILHKYINDQFGDYTYHKKYDILFNNEHSIGKILGTDRIKSTDFY